MPTFAYKARDEIGKAIAGVMEAPTEDALISKLRKLSYVPVSVEESMEDEVQQSSTANNYIGRIKSEDKIVFNMQLASMLDAGITLLSALNIISKQIQNENFRRVIENVTSLVAGGASFSEALIEHPNVFSKLFVSMVRAGETGGKLNEILNRLAVYLEKQEELKQRIKGALFYPAILFVAGILVILLIVTFVMPKFIVIFNKADIALPLPTQMLYGFGIIIKKFWYLLFVGFGLAGFGIKWYGKTLEGRLQYDQLKLKIPLVGPVVRKIIVTRFCRTLATLVNSGVTMLQSLDILRDVVGNEVFGRVVGQVRKSVERGERLDQPLKLSGEFPDDAVHMISVGEETGKLGVMLNKIADFYDTSIEFQVRRLTTLIEPIFITLMGIMVGFIMASMLIPIFDMVKTIQN